ncbi:MAG: hypothetical protein H6505_04880, partial [Calditrichaeota bacterium]|nr:hypothetical protein [Calditrichota bacterium]
MKRSFRLWVIVTSLLLAGGRITLAGSVPGKLSPELSLWGQHDPEAHKTVIVYLYEKANIADLDQWL